MFSDILEIWGPPGDVYDQIQALGSLEDKLAYVRALPRCRNGYCHTHGEYCPFQSCSQFRVQGPPCPDFSQAGKRLGAAGPRLPALLAAGAKAERVNAAAIVVENVPLFPLHLAQEAYGPGYAWVRTVQHPSMVGFEFMARPRLLVSTGVCLLLPLSAVTIGELNHTTLD